MLDIVFFVLLLVSPHVKEPSVTAHYAHDEWSIRDLLHWQNYPSIPITFPVSSPVAFKFLNVLVLNIAEKIARWTLNTNQPTCVAGICL